LHRSFSLDLFEAGI